MTKESFLREIQALGDNQETLVHRTVVSAQSSASGKPVVFDVVVFKKFKGGYKLQYTAEGSEKPQLPQLNQAAIAGIQQVVGRSSTYLTSGFGNHRSGDGMADPETVVRFVDVLKKNGITVEL